MTRSTSFRRTVAAVAAVALAVTSLVAVTGLTGGTAQARESSADQAPLWGTLLFLSVTKGNQVIGTAVLTCNPAGGSHPHPAAACDDLDQARGDFTNLPGVPGTACDDMYDPVQASAVGTWNGPLIGWLTGALRFFSNTYGNICDLYRSTGWVFPLPNTFPPPPPPPSTTTTAPRPTTSSPAPTVTLTIPRPSTTKPTPTVPGPTVTLDPPETTVPNDR
jgi:hypothetical protein